MSPKDSIVWVMRWQETTATLPIAFFFFFFFNIWIVRRVKGCHAGNSIPDTKFAYLPAENRGKQEFSQDYQRSLRSIAERSGFGAVTTIEAGFSARRDVKVCSPLVHTVATATVTKTIDRKKKRPVESLQRRNHRFAGSTTPAELYRKLRSQDFFGGGERSVGGPSCFLLGWFYKR